jgi:hypothetical protein
MKKLLSRVCSLPIHPFLVAAFPIVFLYGQNVRETRLDQVVVPLAASVLSALVLWMAFAIALRDKAKAGLAASTVIFLFFSYGRLYDLMGDWNLAAIHKHSLLAPLLILMCGYMVYFISLLRWDLRSATRLLNIVASALIALNLVPVLLHSIQGVRGPSLVSKVQAGDISFAADNLSMSGPMPDIYYIVLDEYAHPSTMSEFYGYDNSRFVDYLADSGFLVADESRTRNYYTLGSIASTLNMEYVTYNQPCEPVYEMVSHNRVASFLKSFGYQRVYVGSWYDIDRYDVDSDICYNFYKSGYDEVPLLTGDFQGALLNTTMVRPYIDYVNTNRHESYLRDGLIETLDQLKRTPQMEGPKFVFAHILCPHAPFIFGPQGEPVEYAERGNWSDREYYLGQYIFITQQIEKVLDVITTESNVPPIIVLQSDHGIRPWWPGLDASMGDEWQKILNAYRLPDGGTEELWGSISPANSFRFIFNYYFHADFELLEE